MRSCCRIGTLQIRSYAGGNLCIEAFCADQEDQQAELSTIGDSLSAFADDMQTLEDAGPQEAQASVDVKVSFPNDDIHSCDMA